MFVFMYPPVNCLVDIFGIWCRLAFVYVLYESYFKLVIIIILLLLNLYLHIQLLTSFVKYINVIVTNLCFYFFRSVHQLKHVILCELDIILCGVQMTLH